MTAPNDYSAIPAQDLARLRAACDNYDAMQDIDPWMHASDCTPCAIFGAILGAVIGAGIWGAALWWWVS